MHAERVGSGPDVYVGVHGWGGSHATFLPIAPYVPASATLHAVDLPGYGRSAWHDVDSAAGIAQPIAELIERLDTPRVTLIGNCSGAILGLLANELAPSRITRFVLIDPFAFLPWYFKVFVHPAYGRVAYHSTFANPIGRWATNLSLKKNRTAASDLTSSFQDVDHEVSLRYLTLLDAVPSIERFRTVTVPIDIAYGARTFGAVRQSVAMWCELWPHARAHVIPGAGHLPLEDAPAEVARIAFAGVGSARG
ncbi:MAG: alpha/beta hydrolase [Vicinamibacterales bacterium]